MRYLVTGHSIIVSPDTIGTDPDGNERRGRHWFQGSVVDLEPAEAEALFSVGAVGPAPEVAQSSKKAPASPPSAPQAVEESWDDRTDPATPKALSEPPGRRKGKA